MILCAHPTGNSFVRAVLAALQDRGMLQRYWTTMAVQPGDWPLRPLPARLRRQALRRSYVLPDDKISRFPWRELVRQAAGPLRLPVLARHETGWASLDRVSADLDRRAARAVRMGRGQDGLTGVYAYEDCAWELFRAAGERGLTRFYDLPIAYWETSRRLLDEEAERWPDWEPTLVGTRDSAAKQRRKTQELAAADIVLTPSRFVLDSLPAAVRTAKPCHVVEFGSPPVSAVDDRPKPDLSRPLRVLFAGSMTQRKGLADLFAALKRLKRPDVELVVMGSPLAPLEFYRQQYADFRYEPPRPHDAVLALMRSCDIFVLPSIVEGRALVQQEALACGLPLIVTPNAGGEDLIEEGQTGFLVPIRAPEALADRIAWFADRRNTLPAMRRSARAKAAEYTWERYGRRVAEIVCRDADVEALVETA